MLHPRFPRILGFELADPARIPQFARDAEILTASHQRVGPTSLGGGRDAVGGEVILFAASDGNEPGT